MLSSKYVLLFTTIFSKNHDCSLFENFSKNIQPKEPTFSFNIQSNNHKKDNFSFDLELPETQTSRKRKRRCRYQHNDQKTVL